MRTLVTIRALVGAWLVTMAAVGVALYLLVAHFARGSDPGRAPGAHGQGFVASRN